MAKYKFKEGFEVVYSYTSKINNDNLTDEIAEHLLAKGTVKESDFEQIEKKETIKTKTNKN